MRFIQIPLLALLAVLLAAVGADAQTVIKPGQAIPVSWGLPDTTVANAPEGYRFETFRETEAGVVITTTDVPVSPTQAELPASVLPQDGEWLLVVRAYNAAGVSGRSNALPFVLMQAPPTPINLALVPTP